MSNNIHLKTIEEIAAEKAANCLPHNMRAISVGQKIVFVRRWCGRWIPVSKELQEELEKKHIVS